MPSLDLLDSASPLLPWLAGGVAVAIVLVLAIWLAVRAARRNDEANPSAVLIPTGPDPSSPSARARQGLAAAFAPRRVLVGLAALVVLALAVVAYRSAGSGSDWTPSYVESPTGPSRDGGPRPASGAGQPDLQPGEPGTAIDPQSGEQVGIYSGNQQTGTLGRLLPRSLAVLVRNAEGRPAANREIRFEVSPGGGSVGSTSVRTSSSGLATTTWQLGRDPGALEVRAYLADRPDISVRFTATGQRGPGLATGAAGGAESGPGPSEASIPAASTGRTNNPTAVDAPTAASPSRAGKWAAGGVHTCRVDGAGAISCWGSGGSGPTRAMSSMTWGVAAGLFHTCGISVSATVGCWVASEDANDRSIVGEWSIPGSGDPVELAVGAEHVCARTDTGRVFCWGSGSRGQLGTGAQQQATGPVAVDGVDGVVQLVSGWFHTCALTDESSVFCWGANEAGQLGIGVPGNQSRPVPVDQEVPFSSIAAGSKRSCGLDRNGGVWCWGDNQAGALGTDAVSSADVPRRLDTDVPFTSLTVGGAHTCGLTRSGRAWCWGQNVFGQLGTGTTEDSSVPLPVAGDIRFSFLISGGAHTCGESVGGNLYCWGNNFSGQLGDGTQENSRTPVIARS